MPNPNEKYHNPLSREFREFTDMLNPAPSSDLLAEIRELRREVKALADALKPVDSLIATGQAVIEEFKRIKEPTP